MRLMKPIVYNRLGIIEATTSDKLKEEGDFAIITQSTVNNETNKQTKKSFGSEVCK